MKTNSMKTITVSDLKLKQNSVLLNKIAEDRIYAMENDKAGNSICLNSKEDFVSKYVEFINTYKPYRISFMKDSTPTWSIGFFFFFWPKKYYDYYQDIRNLFKTKTMTEQGIQEFSDFLMKTHASSFSLVFTKIRNKSLQQIYGKELSVTEFDILTYREKNRLLEKRNAL